MAVPTRATVRNSGNRARNRTFSATASRARTNGFTRGQQADADRLTAMAGRYGRTPGVSESSKVENKSGDMVFSVPPPTFEQQGPSVSKKPANNFSTEPAVLSAAARTELNRRRRKAMSAFENARINANLQRGATESAFTRSTRDVAREAAGMTRDAKSQWADRGLGFSPAFAGRAVSDIGAQKTQRQNELALDKGARMAAIDEMVAQARAAKEAELGAIEEERALARTAPELYIQTMFGGN